MKSLMKICLKTDNSGNISLSLLFLRIIVGVFMLTHGYGKFLMLMGDGPIQFADPIGIGVTASLILAVFAEFICSILLIFGVLTRLSAIPLLTTMLVAGLIVHARDAFNVKELALLYASIYLVIIIAGAGKYSVDNWLFKRLKL
ncbi:MAG: DoxX family protein [Bacteroidales bacterium]|jgi:putative oxidoreductase|nr:DoxX family protein [Bacteroidales bacterium]